MQARSCRLLLRFAGYLEQGGKMTNGLWFILVEDSAFTSGLSVLWYDDYFDVLEREASEVEIQLWKALQEGTNDETLS